MKPFEERFTAWVDGQMSGDELTEFEKELATHPSATEDRQGAQRLGALLRNHPTAPELTNPDFFNHQIMERIEAETVRPAPRTTSFWSLPRLLWAGAFCLLIALGLFKTVIPDNAPTPAKKSKYFAQVVEAWPSDPSITATTVYSPEDNVTVVWLDGLDYLPASYALN